MLYYSWWYTLDYGGLVFTETTSVTVLLNTLMALFTPSKDPVTKGYRAL